MINDNETSWFPQPATIQTTQQINSSPNSSQLNNNNDNNSINITNITKEPYNKLSPISKLLHELTHKTKTVYNRIRPILNNKSIEDKTKETTKILLQQEYQSQEQPYQSQITITSETYDNNQTTTQEQQLLNHEEPKENIPYGDNINHKNPETTRIIFQNIHGLRSTNKLNCKWKDCLQTIAQHKADIVGLAETCTNWTNKRICQQYSKEARHQLQNDTIQVCYSHNNYYHDSLYLPGGTLQLSIGGWATRIKQQLHDPHHMGRWSGIQYQLCRQRSLYIITGYRVCKQDNNLGVFSSYKQQLLALKQRYPDKPEQLLQPRQYFITDLIQYITDLNITTDDYLIVQLDANEVIGEDKTHGLLHLMTTLKLQDIIPLHHKTECNIASYTGSKDRRIDYILGTLNIVPLIDQCGYLPFHTGMESDHRAIFIDLKQELTTGKVKLQRPQQRLIGYTTNKNELVSYKEYISEKFNELNIFNRMQQLYDESENILPNDEAFTDKLN